MEYRKIPRSDLDVSVICLGTMTWGEQNTEAEGHEQMDYALEQGVNFFDTAEMYPVPPMAETCHRTEEIIGTWSESKLNILSNSNSPCIRHCKPTDTARSCAHSM